MQGQGSVDRAESERVMQILGSAAQATSAEQFMDAIQTARSILARQIPGREDYRPDRRSPWADEQQPGRFQPLTPPPAGGGSRTVDADGLAGLAPGTRVYDSETGNWGRVQRDGTFRRGW